MTMTTYRGRVRQALATAALAAVAACSPSSIVEVDTPDVATPPSVLTPTGLDALRANAISEFIFANSGNDGGTEGTILVTGLFTDEFPLNDTFQGRFELDNRSTTERNDRLLPYYRAVHRARRAAEFASASIRRISLTPNTDFRVPEMHIFAALAYVALAENFCSPQPVSTLNADNTETYGPPLTQAQVFARASAQLDSALAYITAAGTGIPAATATRLNNFARVVQARIRTETATTPAEFAAAAALVTAVPANFREITTHSTTTGRQNNGIHVFNWLSRRYSVADREAASPTELTGTIPPGVGLDFRGANDPRVRSQRPAGGAGTGFDNASPLFRLGKYFERTTSIPIADFLEAQLIIAESQLQAGNEAGYIATLNGLRANQALYPLDPFASSPAALPPVLPALTAPSAGVIDAADVNLLFRERAFWLYGTGHRLADLRRLMRQYGRTEAATFPGGGGRPYFLENQTLARVNRLGINYGAQVAFTIPFDETNNPQFTAAQLAACNPLVP